jgi:RNA polymerase sigma-70 factor (ECF subfamily)
MVEELPLPAFTTTTTRDTAHELTALAGLHSALLYRLAFSVLRNSAEAEDIVQESFLRALRTGDKFFNVDEPRQWLMRVTWNLALDRKRRTTPQQMDDILAASLPDLAITADAALDQSRSIARVFAAIDTLPKLERHVLTLSALEELDVTAIATLLNRSPSAIRGLLFRARTHLRQRLATTKESAQ